MGESFRLAGRRGGIMTNAGPSGPVFITSNFVILRDLKFAVRGQKGSESWKKRHDVVLWRV